MCANPSSDRPRWARQTPRCIVAEMSTFALPDKLEVLWKFSAGDSIEGAPAIAGGVVYLASLDVNGDGVINGLDFAAFRGRFGTVI